MKKEQNFENTAKKAKKPSTFTIKQLIWFILGVLISVNALIFLILGLINDYAPLAYSPFATPNDAMKTAMTEITIDGLTGKQITWSEDGEPSKEPTVVVIENGAYSVL